MSAKKIIKPSIVIGGTEFKCLSDEVSLEPGNAINFCEDEWTMSTNILLSYGVGGSHTALQAMELTEQTVVVSPSDGSISADNPSATFTAQIPKIPFMSGAKRGDRQSFTLELMSDGDPVFATS
ncbi:MAG: hypothetical protein AAGA37_19785 [Actinomycetota bacterium]